MLATDKLAACKQHNSNIIAVAEAKQSYKLERLWAIVI